jgi:CheY-like chemotaxis protein/HPt (histidine-containing phosphotransfer) domain-containing protein
VEVAREFLEIMGCSIDVVQNGLEAIAAARNRAYDLILMDCQMPELDGLSATRKIRAFEATHGRTRTPIVAVTANAFAEDREMCTAHGMDDYLSKPYTEAQLAAAIGRWAPQTREPAREAASEAMATVPADIDTSALASLRASRPHLHARLLSTYLAYSPQVVADLAAAIAAGNAAALKLAAHSLKSSSANVGARRVAELSKVLEAMSSAGSVEAAADVGRTLEAEFRAVCAAFERELQRDGRRVG